jgi:hypothetical protein
MILYKIFCFKGAQIKIRAYKMLEKQTSTTNNYDISIIFILQAVGHKATGNDESTGSYILQEADGGFILLSDSASSNSFEVTDTNYAAGSGDYWLLKLLPSLEIGWISDTGQR